MRSSLSNAIDEALAPAPDPRRVEPLKRVPFAHRGLHGEGRVENSRAAFTAAIAQCHSIELDVQAARGGEAFVFHDYQLDRLTAEQGAVADRNASDLGRVALKGTDETIPSLPDILGLIGGRVPLLIEVKAKDKRVAPLCLSVRRALEGYGGAVGVMSFNPQVGRWFASHAPRIVRGLVVSESDKRGVKGRIERSLALWRSKPDFLAYDIRDLPSRFAARARARGLAVMTWTVRDERQRETAARHADQPIYELPLQP
jgi:glycerophosphoryl diester phosphodiesterase